MHIKCREDSIILSVRCSHKTKPDSHPRLSTQRYIKHSSSHIKETSMLTERQRSMDPSFSTTRLLLRWVLRISMVRFVLMASDLKLLVNKLGTLTLLLPVRLSSLPVKIPSSFLGLLTSSCRGPIAGRTQVS